MVIPALLATALTACPQAPAPTPNVAPAPTQEQQIEARGLSTPKDMMLHGILAGNSFQSNQGFTLQNGSSVHANTGLILNSRNIVLNGGQVSSTSTATCSDNSGMGFCLKGKPKFIAPMVVIPKADIPALKTKYSATPSITIQGNLNLNSSSEISTRFDNQIILVKGSVNLNAVATIKNATILVEETLSSNKGITLENTRIISKGIGLNQATKLSNSRIITDEDLTVNGTLESLGISSLISSKNITTNQTTSSTTGELAIIANQNITMNQSSSGKIAVWANGNVNLNQVSSLEGSVVAGGKVTLNQRVTLTKVLQHVNGDVLGGGSFENIPETLTLTAGATIRLQNGVVIKAPIGSFDGSVNITVTEVPKERSTIPLPSNMEAVAKYYTIRSSRTIGSGEGFTVGLPIIGQIAPENTTLAQQYLVRYGVGSTVPIDLWSATVNRPFENLAGGILVYLMAEDYLVTAVKYPVGNIIVPNSPSANSGNLKTQATNSNLLEIETIQCDIPNALLNINTCFGLYGEIVDSIKTFTRLLSLTSAEVPIIRILQMKPSNDPECSGIGGYYFQQKIVICVQPDLSVTSGVSAHEVFHAVQERLFFSRKLLFNYTNSNFWIIESTAEAAAFSRETMQSSERSRFPIEKKISDNSTSSYRYQLNDFWVFVGKKLGKGVGFLKDLFVIQHSLQDTDPSTTNLVSNFRLVDTFLKNQGYTSGLSGAYSDWIRSYSIERKILIRSSDTINNVDQSCIPVIDVLQNQDGIRLSLGLSLRMPVAFSSVKNNIGSPLSTQNTYVKFTLSGQGAITSQVRIVARSSKNHVKFVVYERQRGDPPNQNCFDKAESLAPLVTKPGSPDNSFYTFSQNFTVTQKSEFIVLAINSDFTESADIQFRVEDIQAQVAVPSRIDLTGNVGL